MDGSMATPKRDNPTMSRRAVIVLVVVYALLAVAVTVILFPVFWMASSSLKPQSELFARNMTMVLARWPLENLR